MSSASVSQPFVFNAGVSTPSASGTDSLVNETRREIAKIVREVAAAVRPNRTRAQFLAFLTDRILRAMAAEGWSFGIVVTARIAGTMNRLSAKSNRRSLGLAFYHAMSVVYRALVLFSVATLGFGIASYLHLHPLASIMVVEIARLPTTRLLKRFILAIWGKDDWEGVPLSHRGVLATGLLLFVVGGLCLPTRRFRQVTGLIDSADPTTVYLDTDGLIERVSADYGDRVTDGDSLVELHHKAFALEVSELRGRLAVARLRRVPSRRSSLDRTSRDEGWQTLEAAEQSLQTQLASVQDRVRKTAVTSPVGGIVIPPRSKRE